jgi:hypothetical protein
MKIKQLLIGKLWILFCFYNGYYLKNIIKEIFNKNELPTEIEVLVARFILNLGIPVPIEEFESIPSSIKEVLLQMQNNFKVDKFSIDILDI